MKLLQFRKKSEFFPEVLQIYILIFLVGGLPHPVPAG